MKYFLYLISILFSHCIFAQALPVSNAISSGITNNLIARGFAANDPRIISTISAVSSRISTIAAADVAAAGVAGSAISTVSAGSWIGAAARIVPVVSTGILIYQGLNWYFDTSGKVTTNPPGTQASLPVYSNGISAGNLCWTTGGFTCFGSHQEAISYMFSLTVAIYPNASYSNITSTENSATSVTYTYTASIPEIYIKNSPSSKEVTAISYNGISCPSGSGSTVGSDGKQACVSAQLEKSPFVKNTNTPSTLQQAYSNIPTNNLNNPVSQNLMSELANRFWRDAASQPNYQGVPFSASSPVTNDAFSPSSSTWPQLKDLGTTIPTSSTALSPVNTSDTSNATNTAAGATKVDLGLDPGTPSPSLETTPTGLEIMNPITSELSSWFSFSIPSHASVCPTASFSFWGKNYTFDAHCQLLNQNANLLQSAMSALWLIVAIFILLGA